MVQKYTSNILTQGSLTGTSINKLNESGMDVVAFAQSVDRASSNLFGIAIDEQNQINNIAAIDAANKFQEKVAAMMYDQKNGLLNKQGRDAISFTGEQSAGKFFTDSLDGMEAEVSKSLTNDVQREAFKRQINDFKLRTRTQAESHVANETKKYSEETLNLSVGITTKNMLLSLQTGGAFGVSHVDDNGNPITVFDGLMAEVYAKNRQLAMSLGKPLAWGDDKSQKEVQSVMVGAVEQKIASGKVNDAIDLYNKYPGQFPISTVVRMSAIKKEKDDNDLADATVEKIYSQNNVSSNIKALPTVTMDGDGKPVVTHNISVANEARRKIESNNTHFGKDGSPLKGISASGRDMGARGISQLVPKTAEETAKKNGIPWNPELFNRKRTGDAKKDAEAVEYNKRLGDLHFEEMVKRYNGNVEAALVSYNAGQGVADAYFFGKPTWVTSPSTGKRYLLNPDGVKTPNGLPPKGFDETRKYLQRYNSEAQKISSPTTIKTKIINGKEVPEAGQLSQPPTVGAQQQSSSISFPNFMTAESYVSAQQQAMRELKDNPDALKLTLGKLKSKFDGDKKARDEMQNEVTKALLLNGESVAWNVNAVKDHLRHLDPDQAKQIISFYQSQGDINFDNKLYGQLHFAMDKMPEKEFLNALSALPAKLHKSLIEERNQRIMSQQGKSEKEKQANDFTKIDYSKVDYHLSNLLSQSGIISKKDKDQNASRISSFKMAFISAVEDYQLQNKKKATDVELSSLASRAFNIANEGEPLFKKDVSNLPFDEKQKLKSIALARGVQNPTDEQLLQFYLEGKIKSKEADRLSQMSNFQNQGNRAFVPPKKTNINEQISGNIDPIKTLIDAVRNGKIK